MNNEGAISVSGCFHLCLPLLRGQVCFRAPTPWTAFEYMAMMEETIERSSMAVKAALSPSSLPQWSTGRVEVSKVPARS
jgi:hypothetical protein